MPWHVDNAGANIHLAARELLPLQGRLSPTQQITRQPGRHTLTDDALTPTDVLGETGTHFHFLLLTLQLFFVYNARDWSYGVLNKLWCYLTELGVRFFSLGTPLYEGNVCAGKGVYGAFDIVLTV